MKILCATHSSRPFFEARCSVNQVEQRFGKRNWDRLPPLDSYPPVRQSISFTGALTLWKIDEQNGYRLTFLSSYTPDCKVQFATFTKDTLLVLGSDRLEVLDTTLTRIHTIRDPWLVGGHTVYLDDHGHALVTSSPANAVLVIDLENQKVIERIPMPEMYGKGHSLQPTDDLHKHFISTDDQPTHVNCAYPVDDGILVTSFVHGSVGFFDRQRNYREIVRGYRGCHGGKRDRQTGDLYLTDSASGNILFFDYKTGVVKRRFHLDSKWLHDSDQIDGTVFSVGLSDSNKIQIIDLASETVFSSVDCDLFGKSAMFVHVCGVSHEWETALDAGIIRSQLAIDTPELEVAKEFIPPLSENSFWTPISKTKITALLKTETELRYDFLVESDVFFISPGEYIFQSAVVCRKGGISIGLLDRFSNQWISQLYFDTVNYHRSKKIKISNSTYAFAVIAANNPGTPSLIDTEIQAISLKQTPGTLPSDESNIIAPEDNWPNIVPSFDDETAWTLMTDWALRFDGLIFGKQALKYEPLLQSGEIVLTPGNYVFDGEIYCLQGGVQFGLLDYEANEWVLVYAFDPERCIRREYPVIPREKKVRIVITASNESGPALTSAELKRIALRKIED